MYKKEMSGICTVALVLALQSSAANADRMGEFSVFAGAHLFNENNELGIVDESDADSLTNAVTFGVRAAFALTRMLDLEGELAITPTTARDSGVDVVAFGWRGSALFHILDGRFRPFLLAGAGASTSSSSDERIFSSDTDLLAHVGVGAKYAIEDNWGIRVDARLLLPPSSENESVTIDSEFQFSLYKNFGPLPPPKPPTVVDGDGDGIPDETDKCVSQAEDMDGFEDEDGCPDVDNDGDGIIDSADECPKEAEDVDGFEDADGCPELDNDKDGILDAADQCPVEAEDMDGFEDEDGCPELDNDSDGVLDAADTCPLEAETFNGFEDKDGCPDVLPEAVQSFSGSIEGIRFAVNSARIRPVSFAVLNQAVAVFTEYPELRIEVQGHTDTEGSAEVNTKLSQDRAQATVDYLVKKGIAPERLRAKGYGPSVPKEDNATKEGREANRRIEFQLLSDEP